MDALYELIFAQPTPIVAALLIIALPLGYLAWRRRGWMWLAAAAPVTLAGLLLLADGLVQTDREKIERLLTDAAEHVRNSQWDKLGELATADFEWQIRGHVLSAGRDNTLAKAKAVAGPLSLKSVKLSDVELIVNGPAAAVTARAVMIAGGPKSPGTGDTRWQFDLARQADGRWLIRTANLLELDGRPIEALPMMMP